jgi:hypothetical protein
MAAFPHIFGEVVTLQQLAQTRGQRGGEGRWCSWPLEKERGGGEKSGDDGCDSPLKGGSGEQGGGEASPHGRKGSGGGGWHGGWAAAADRQRAEVGGPG